MSPRSHVSLGCDGTPSTAMSVSQSAEFVGDIVLLAQASPSQGRAVEVADGVWWIQLELGDKLKHVNVYLLEDNGKLVLVDTGSRLESCQLTLQNILESAEFVGKPLRDVYVTHHHPDHIGLAGWLAQRSVVLHMSATCWRTAHHILAMSPLPNESQIAFQQLAGLSLMEIEAFRRRKLHQYHELVSPLPASFCVVNDKDVIRIGKRKWKVHFGNGHAKDHLTLWSDDGLAIVGDQILAGISPNLCVQACEEFSDPLGEFLESCQVFATRASLATKCLPGHNFPFAGIPKRCEQLVANQNMVLARLLEQLSGPKRAVDCLESIYRRPIGTIERPAFVTQVMAFLSHLQKRTLVESKMIGTSLLWNRSLNK